jgi:leucyl aminopeptidase
VHDEAAIKRLKLGGLLGVNRGSAQPPRFVELTYEPAGRATGTLALVGKGITFDSGGLSIKTGQGMMTMKCDMGGAAAVLAEMTVLPVVKPRARVRAFVPMTDNMTGPDATRPGDVLRIRNGKSVEVLNTDAEGRLILADALSLASEAKPDAIVDLATLTGACMVALGPSIAGLMGDETWVAQVRAAADRAGERVWPLPLPADYRKQLDSPVADLKNIGGQYGGSLTAGLFLKEFVGNGTAWAHLDIAGPAFLDAEDGENPKGASGFGVRLLVELARSFEKPVTPAP